MRPGRVDLSVEFGLLDSNAVSGMFLRIYSSLEYFESPQEDGLTEPTCQRDESTAEEKPLSYVEVSDLAESFARIIPPLVFTPAEIQGYLLLHKDNPAGAVAGAERWAQEAKRESPVVRREMIRVN